MKTLRTVKHYLTVAGSWLMNSDNNATMAFAIAVFVALCVGLSFEALDALDRITSP